MRMFQSYKNRPQRWLLLLKLKKNHSFNTCWWDVLKRSMPSKPSLFILNGVTPVHVAEEGFFCSRRWHLRVWCPDACDPIRNLHGPLAQNTSEQTGNLEIWTPLHQRGQFQCPVKDNMTGWIYGFVLRGPVGFNKIGPINSRKLWTHLGPNGGYVCSHCP